MCLCESKFIYVYFKNANQAENLIGVCVILIFNLVCSQISAATVAGLEARMRSCHMLTTDITFPTGLCSCLREGRGLADACHPINMHTS